MRRSRRDGTLVDVELLAVPVTVGGEQVGTFAMYHDITELQRAYQQAEAANRAKSQDYEGTSVTVSVARKLGVPRMMLVVNNTPPGFDFGEVQDRVEKTYDCEVAADEGEQALFTVTAAGRLATTEVRLRYPKGEQRHKAGAGEVPAFSSLRQATFWPEVSAVTQLKVWAHKVTPEGDSEGIAWSLRVRQGDKTKEFDLKLSKRQVVLPVAPGTCQVDITLAPGSRLRLYPGEGHISIFDNPIKEIVETLLAP